MIFEWLMMGLTMQGTNLLRERLAIRCGSRPWWLRSPENSCRLGKLLEVVGVGKGIQSQINHLFRCPYIINSSSHIHHIQIHNTILCSYILYIYYIYKYIDRVDRISSSPYTYVYIYICTVVPIKFNFVSLFVRLFGPIPILLQNDSHR